MDHYKTMPESPVDGNVLVYGPHGFNASADTFEDAVTFVCRLDDQHAEINKLRRMLHLADSMYEQAATQANDYAAENAALRAEVERLREERRWRTFPANLPDANGRYVCMWADGDIYIQRWETGKWLGAFDHEITHWQPLPAPPDRDWCERKIPHDEGEVGAGVPAPPVEEE